MTALYPISVAAEDYQVGDNVRWFINTDVSPYVGKVVAISPKTYKVWVTWPIGETQQHSPEELILVPKYEGMSVVQQDNGYDSYDKQQSASTFGTMTPTSRAKAASVLAERFSNMVVAADRMASFKANTAKLASDFGIKMATVTTDEAEVLKNEGKTSKQAFEVLYEKYGSHLGDAVVKQAIDLIYL